MWWQESLRWHRASSTSRSPAPGPALVRGAAMPLAKRADRDRALLIPDAQRSSTAGARTVQREQDQLALLPTLVRIRRVAPVIAPGRGGRRFRQSADQSHGRFGGPVRQSAEPRRN